MEGFHFWKNAIGHFKTITKQEVLMLPGIGKKTVEQLEHNGVIFKA